MHTLTRTTVSLRDPLLTDNVPPEAIEQILESNGQTAAEVWQFNYNPPDRETGLRRITGPSFFAISHPNGCLLYLEAAYNAALINTETTPVFLKLSPQVSPIAGLGHSVEMVQGAVILNSGLKKWEGLPQETGERLWAALLQPGSWPMVQTVARKLGFEPPSEKPTGSPTDRLLSITTRASDSAVEPSDPDAPKWVM